MSSNDENTRDWQPAEQPRPTYPSWAPWLHDLDDLLARLRAEKLKPILNLRCANCGVESDEKAHGWRALLTGDGIEVEGIEVFCPACAREEFDNA